MVVAIGTAARGDAEQRDAGVKWRQLRIRGGVCGIREGIGAEVAHGRVDSPIHRHEEGCKLGGLADRFVHEASQGMCIACQYVHWPRESTETLKLPLKLLDKVLIEVFTPEVDHGSRSPRLGPRRQLRCNFHIAWVAQAVQRCSLADEDVEGCEKEISPRGNAGEVVDADGGLHCLEQVGMARGRLLRRLLRSVQRLETLGDVWDPNRSIWIHTHRAGGHDGLAITAEGGWGVVGTLTISRLDWRASWESIAAAGDGVDRQAAGGGSMREGFCGPKTKPYVKGDGLM